MGDIAANDRKGAYGPEAEGPEAEGLEAGRRETEEVDVDRALLGGATYRGLAEQRLSPAEERFERRRRTAGLFLAPALAAVFLALPLDMAPRQQTFAGILLGVAALWITEAVPIPVGGLIGVAAVVLMGVAEASEALAPFGSSTVFTFIGAFILAQAMLKHGLAQRFALRMLSLRGVGGTVNRLVVAFGVITALLSAFVSNTATVAMLLPTALGILSVIAKAIQGKGGTPAGWDPTRLRVGFALMLMLAYGASVGGLLTPVGTPPNLIGRALIEEATGERISFAQWTLTALPICALMFAALTVILLLLNRPEIRLIDGVGEYVAEQRARLGPLSRAERNTLAAFGITAALWIFPGVVALVAGTNSAVYDTVSGRLNEGIVAVLGASLLFLLPTDWGRREATLNWSDAARIDWGTILLFGTGIIFGSLLADTGLAKTIGTASVDRLGLGSAVSITAFAVVLAVLTSETTSNTASAAVVVPIVIPVAVAAGVDPFGPALAATFAASFGFMLPVSTPQNAVVYGSGVVPITRMIRSGAAFDVIGALLIFIGLPVMIAVTGIGG